MSDGFSPRRDSIDIDISPNNGGSQWWQIVKNMK
jgi:hypothetical protein